MTQPARPHQPSAPRRAGVTGAGLLLGLGLTGVLQNGCVSESYPEPATAVRRTPKASLPDPVGAEPRPVRFDSPAAGAAGAEAEPLRAPVADRTGASWPHPGGVAMDDPAEVSAPAAVSRVVHPAPAVAEAPNAAAPARTASGNFARYGELPGDQPRERGGDRASAAGGPAPAVSRVTFAEEGADADVAADPAGRFIVFASTRHRAASDLYLQRVGSSAVTQLTGDPARDAMPALSPDGRRLAWASDRSGTWDLYLRDLHGGPTRRLTDDGGQNLHPSFSADGRRLVYCTRPAGATRWEIVLIDLDQPERRRFVGEGLFPAFNPKDDRIVYQRARERGGRWFSLWTMDLAGPNPGPPTEIAASSNAALITPAWSPDGTRIAFCTVLDPAADKEHAGGAGTHHAHADAATQPPSADLWVCDADGGRRARVTRGGFAHLQPAWSVDAGDHDASGASGSTAAAGSIYFISNRGPRGGENVYALRPDGRGARDPNAPQPPPLMYEAGVDPR